MPSDIISEVCESLLRLYGGRLLEYQPIESEPRLRAISVSNLDFRDNCGNWPKIFHRDRIAKQALVLIHGLTDSPFWLEAIARELARRQDELSVVLPLLPGHGRKDPVRQMTGVHFEDWRAIVDRAVDIACMLGEEVSIGGFSTGGTLCMDKVLRTPEQVQGKVLLFSAALDLPDARKLYVGTHREDWIENIIAGRTENDGEGGDPCKYSRMFVSSVEQFEVLLAELRSVVDAGHGFGHLSHKDRTFVAHSEADDVIDIAAVLPLIDPHDANQHCIIPRSLGVTHNSLVLDKDRLYTPRFIDERPPPSGNPRFGEMTSRASAFLQRPIRSSEDEYMDLLLDAQTAKGNDPEAVRRVALFANKAKYMRKKHHMKTGEENND